MRYMIGNCILEISRELLLLVVIILVSRVFPVVDAIEWLNVSEDVQTFVWSDVALELEPDETY